MVVGRSLIAVVLSSRSFGRISSVAILSCVEQVLLESGVEGIRVLLESLERLHVRRFALPQFFVYPFADPQINVTGQKHVNGVFDPLGINGSGSDSMSNSLVHGCKSRQGVDRFLDSRELGFIGSSVFVELA